MKEMETFRVDDVPSLVYYVPNFISTDEETALMKCIYEAPKPKWTALSNRRLQNWGGIPHPKGMLQEPIPSWLQTYMDRITGLGVFPEKPPNHVLINEYLVGQGIMPHHDGSLYYPTVSTISLGSHTLLDFYNPLSDDEETGSSTSFESRFVTSLLLEPRSLVIIKDKMYTHFMHGIREVVEDDLSCGSIGNRSSCSLPTDSSVPHPRGTRVSITIRNVPKVSKGGLFLLRK